MVVILGVGFTGRRLARRLLRAGEQVFAAVRALDRFHDLAEAGLTLCDFASAESTLPRRAVLVDLIPPLPESENNALRKTIAQLAPKRVVYVSSTGVYGECAEVNEKSPACPADERGRRRLEEEQWIASHPWSTLILRAAAIYGPRRGVHAAIREGKLPRGAGSGVVSRIHVEDLAALVAAGISADVEGAWPVADDDPCSTEEIAAWCAEHMGLGGPPPAGNKLSIAGRRVDGSKIREILRVRLQYSSWKTGIPASIYEEKTGNS